MVFKPLEGNKLELLWEGGVLMELKPRAQRLLPGFIISTRLGGRCQVTQAGDIHASSYRAEKPERAYAARPISVSFLMGPCSQLLSRINAPEKTTLLICLRPILRLLWTPLMKNCLISTCSIQRERNIAGCIPLISFESVAGTFDCQTTQPPRKSNNANVFSAPRN